MSQKFQIYIVHVYKRKKNNYRLFTATVICTVFVFSSLGCKYERFDKSSEYEEHQQPNIIFILTDDLGYGDVGVIFQNQRAVQGKPHHKTPHFDRLADEGMLLTRHYAGAPVCAPSRASLLQGVHQGHANIRNNQFDKALSDNHNLATVLKQAGYTTGIVGKWGLQGTDGDSPEEWEGYPTKRGFDYFFGQVSHYDGHNHYPAHEVAQRSKMKIYSGSEEISNQLRGVYTTDLFTAMAKKWITDHRQEDPGQPFFLYLAYDTPHAGLEIAPSPYPEGGGVDGGVQWIGEQDKFINTADETIDDYFHPDYSGQDWPITQKRHASMVRRIDDGVGDLMQLLRDLEIDKNTFVVFTSDNGPHRESYGYGEFDPTFFESFGPLDGIKRDVWEGGIRVPTIVHWPGQIPSGTQNDTPSGFHDWLPTFTDLTGIPAPASTDGVSLLPVLTGDEEQTHSIVYIEYFVQIRGREYPQFKASRQGRPREEMQVIYKDGYKGVRYDIQTAADDFHIYDTLEDPGERKDLAGSSEYFQDLQKRMKEKVLRLRRPDSSAGRPYDDTPVPSLDISRELVTGLKYQVYEAAVPWTPDIRSLRITPVVSGISEGFDIGIRTRDNDIVIEYSGIIHVPQTGQYSFHLQTDAGAVLRIHEATLIDADNGYQRESIATSKILLEEGYHPVRLTYSRAVASSPLLKLQWSGPGFKGQSVDVEQLYH